MSVSQHTNYSCFFFCPAKKSFIGQNKSIWGPLELVEKLCPESVNIATSARDLPGIKYVMLNHFLVSL